MRIIIVVLLIFLHLLASEDLNFSKTNKYIDSLEYNSSTLQEIKQYLVVNKKFAIFSDKTSEEAGLQFLQLGDCLSRHLSVNDLSRITQSMLTEIKEADLEDDYKYGMQNSVGWWFSLITMKAKAEQKDVSHYKQMFSCDSQIRMPVVSKLSQVTRPKVKALKPYKNENMQFYINEFRVSYAKFIKAEGMVEIFRYDIEKEMSMNCIQRNLYLEDRDKWLSESSKIRKIIKRELTPTSGSRKAERTNTDFKWHNFYLYELNTVHSVEDKLTERYSRSMMNRCNDKLSSYELFREFLPRYIHQYSSDLRYSLKNPSKNLEQHRKDQAVWLKSITKVYEEILTAEGNVSNIDWVEKSLFKMAKGEDLPKDINSSIRDQVNINITDRFGRTPLFYAVKENNIHFLRILLKSNVDMDHKDIYGRTVFDYFNRDISYSIRNALWLKKYTEKHPGFKEKRVKRRVGLQFASEVESYTNKASWSGLMFAVYNGDKVQLYKELDKDINIDDYNNNKTTALHFAVFLNNVEFMKILIEKGANLEVRNRTGLTPLFYAVHNENREAVALLIEKGANVNALTKYKESPLSYAYHYKKLGTFEQLLSLGADINVKDKQHGWTMLTEAMLDNNYDDVMFLLDHGIDIDVKSKIGTAVYERLSSDTSIDIGNALFEAYKKRHPKVKKEDFFKKYYENTDFYRYPEEQKNSKE